jgi:hypothetical protein
MSFILIDPPVSAYSSLREIEAWLRALRKLPRNPEVVDAIKQAEAWLKSKESDSAGHTGG